MDSRKPTAHGQLPGRAVSNVFRLSSARSWPVCAMAVSVIRYGGKLLFLAVAVGAAGGSSVHGYRQFFQAVLLADFVGDVHVG